MVLVHAHPDDEAIPTGATMARYAAEGASVCLVTCTRGERGEIVTEKLAHLREEGPEALGRHREGELAAALAELGVHRHVWLGGLGRWWDSGMVGTPENEDPRAFARADLSEAVRAMVEVLRRERPTVVISDDANGSYGHPDHVQAHRVTMAALDPAADPGYAPELGEPWQVPKVYWTALRRESVRRLAATIGFDIEDDMPGVPDEMIAAEVDGREYAASKVAALRAHYSQVDLEKGFFGKLSLLPDFGVEHFRLVRGERGPAGEGEHGWESDLFAGLAANGSAR
ncbi:MAG: N-acetyl-D-myo-inositol-2-amino-2-deoxy-alpha-D-glucopyranoside deacetylase [Pseudonocardiales bacterium]|jgi:N-acetyl-1-D-myo-inositol-2-amino-2-deoxy-alpha-D-glucopyranoside deacetylase|nr:N-acetyl-D-myo-inositol-2-amino-2-deoxy-alpha-D-glucopyranoside deacetylase [Pseudonocardiales bacterium]MDT7611288.1 N-acetyl-D-myo-inositol-2-amino-2-deoxy-alpha-D-glucopyranoside deacetylase [Pseudonocardiales bacterium]MDT7622802.1 N-acetyl-D-myo-inositol-2-amino-2-deoxy-alpha-D-glucopyranoside deacetylase [Pseudonocardiales bacterium]MDT7676716.1 N-acetyl-D-myo-inositol-2-amino-2-deoxy-alpha-D-glucopyranoside deacetylase [Pseudonocardiales bacterium]MDT7771595.1 N-acetyl-D-myo-inositol-